MKLFPDSQARYRSITPSTDVVPEHGALPVSVERGGSVLGASVSLAMGAALLLLIVPMLVGGERQVDAVTRMIVLAIFIICHVFFVVLGLAYLRKRDVWTLSATAVEHRRRRLWGSREWTEPLSNYAGVLMHEDYDKGGTDGSYFPAYVLDLHHADDSAKTLRLWINASNEYHRLEWERYARLLDVAPLTKTSDGFARHEVEGLNERKRDAVDAPVTLDTALPSGGGLAVHVDAAGVVITMRKGKLAKAVVLAVQSMAVVLFFLLISGLVAIFWTVPLAPLLGGIALVLVAIVLYGACTFQQHLKVSASGVRTWWSHPWGQFSGDYYPTVEIETVAVRSKGVLIVAGAEEESWGAGLKDEELEWVRDCIVAVISA